MFVKSVMKVITLTLRDNALFYQSNALQQLHKEIVPCVVQHFSLILEANVVFFPSFVQLQIKMAIVQLVTKIMGLIQLEGVAENFHQTALQRRMETVADAL